MITRDICDVCRTVEFHGGTVRAAQQRRLGVQSEWKPATVSWSAYGRTSVRDAREFAAAVHAAAAVAYAWNLDGKRVEAARSPGQTGVAGAVHVTENGECSINVTWDNGTFSMGFDPNDLVEVK